MTSVVVNLQVEGLHHWPSCPIPEVSFLRQAHRHMFHVRVEKLVEHDDRAIEIIQLRKQILTALHDCFYSKVNCTHDFGTKSCEQLAKWLMAMFDLDLVEVLEDGENGAIVRKERA